MLRILAAILCVAAACAADPFTGTLTFAATVDKAEGEMAGLAELAKISGTIAVSGGRVTITTSGGLGEGQWHVDRDGKQGWQRESGEEPWRPDPLEIEDMDSVDAETRKLLPGLFACTLTPTGETAEIAGHACVAYAVTDCQLVRGPTVAWIAKDLPTLRCRMRLTTSEPPFNTLVLPVLFQLPIDEGLPLKVTTTDQGVTISYAVTAIAAEATHPEPLPTR